MKPRRLALAVFAASLAAMSPLGARAADPAPKESVPVPAVLARTAIANAATLTRGKHSDHARRVIGRASTDPILAKDAEGHAIDARTKAPLDPAAEKRAKDAEAAYGRPGAVIFADSPTAQAQAGVSAGGLEDGRVTLGQSDHADAHVDALRAEGSAVAQATVGRAGVGGQASASAQATLVGIAAQANTKAGTPDDHLGAAASVNGAATVGGNADASAAGHAGKKGVAADAAAAAFVGAKAGATGEAKANLCGAVATATGTAEASAGIGGEAAAYLQVDWSTLTVKAGAKVSATAGVGAGAGVDVSVSLGKIVDDPKAAADCAKKKVLKPLSRAAKAVGGAIAKAATHVGDAVVQAAQVIAAPSALAAELPVSGVPGNNAARDAETRPAASARTIRGGGGESGAGVAH